jgi:mono/diheme cytochrome c family protein
MSNETVFFILGISLVVIALVVSFAGLRFQKFPSSGPMLIGGIAVVASLVVATGVFAWRNGEDEKAKEAGELAAEAAQNEASGNTAEADEEEGSNAGSATSTTATTSTSSTTTGSGATASVGDAAVGAPLFESQGCSGCHTLAAAGSTGTTGPDLDGALKGKDADFIRTSIVDPNAAIAQGYPENVMPQNFGDVMTPDQINGLVQYLLDSTNGK